LRFPAGNKRITIVGKSASRLIKINQSPAKVYSGRISLAQIGGNLYLSASLRTRNLKAQPVISIVDDDPLVRDATVDLINSLGHTAAAFESAEEFLDSGQVKNTTCLITDQQLPGLSGIELQNQLHVEGYHTPIIFITAFPESKIRERALSAGAVAFLTKPFEEAALVSSLQAALKAA
jgi:CheY-like chemotaxis protein